MCGLIVPHMSLLAVLKPAADLAPCRYMCWAE